MTARGCIRGDVGSGFGSTEAERTQMAPEKASRGWAGGMAQVREGYGWAAVEDRCGGNAGSGRTWIADNRGQLAAQASALFPDFLSRFVVEAQREEFGELQ